MELMMKSVSRLLTTAHYKVANIQLGMIYLYSSKKNQININNNNNNYPYKKKPEYIYLLRHCTMHQCTEENCLLYSVELKYKSYIKFQFMKI